MTQHGSLTPARWATFTLERQILMIANEMHRTAKLMEPADRSFRKNGYERVLRLTDLTIEVQTRPPLRRELLRWRDLIAALYINEAADPSAHVAALRCLLLMTRGSARQIPFVCG